MMRSENEGRNLRPRYDRTVTPYKDRESQSFYCLRIDPEAQAVHPAYPVRPHCPKFATVQLKPPLPIPGCGPVIRIASGNSINYPSNFPRLSALGARVSLANGLHAEDAVADIAVGVHGPLQRIALPAEIVVAVRGDR